MANWYYVVGDERYDYLTQAQMEHNAILLTTVLRAKGWTDIAIAGALGNIQHEGILNPGQCEVGEGVPSGNSDTSYTGGLGLIQWTKPRAGNINPLLRYASENNKNWYDGDLQAEYIDYADDYSMNYGLWGWIESSTYPVSFSDFKQLSTTPTEAAYIWLYNLERPNDPSGSGPTRAENAERWYQYIQQASYTPRLEMGDIYTSPYYTTWNAYWTATDSGRINMPNCTAYCFGRWNELTDTRERHSNFPTGAGYQWYSQGIAKGFTGGTVPQLGAVACWDYMGIDEGEYTHTGHVAVVEQINYDSQGNPVSIVTSNSAWYRGEDWDEPRNEYPWFYTETLDLSTINDPWGREGSQFLGFLYNENIIPIPPTPPTPTKRKMPFIFYLKRQF